MSIQNVESEISGTVWKIEVKAGERINEEDTLMVLESMKMEIPVSSPCTGTVLSIEVAEGDIVADGQLLAVIGR